MASWLSLHVPIVWASQANCARSKFGPESVPRISETCLLRGRVRMQRRIAHHTIEAVRKEILADSGMGFISLSRHPSPRRWAQGWSPTGRISLTDRIMNRCRYPDAIPLWWSCILHARNLPKYPQALLVISFGTTSAKSASARTGLPVGLMEAVPYPKRNMTRVQ